MITMNDTVSIKMTLTKAHLLASVLSTAAYDVMDTDRDESERLKMFAKIIKEQISRLDYSENETKVDMYTAPEKPCCESCGWYHQNDPDYPDNCEYPDNPPCNGL